MERIINGINCDFQEEMVNQTPELQQELLEDILDVLLVPSDNVQEIVFRDYGCQITFSIKHEYLKDGWYFIYGAPDTRLMGPYETYRESAFECSGEVIDDY
jgi:hypothetical protein